MTPPNRQEFLAGVIAGFYGPPWSPAERLTLFDGMQAWGLNTCLYAPKDDLKHRALWGELYSANEADGLADLVCACQQRHLRFIYALSPGLDIRFSEAAEVDRLIARYEQILALGCVHGRAANPDAPARSDYHLPGTFRGGMVARLQQLPHQNPDGTFTPSSAGNNTISNP